MVSTRGIKFKFSEGEKVLCYEPDPTKAKVLYDSRVLELNVNRDNKGRKVPEYLIHFYGWSSNWDRCVKEEFILPNTEKNRNLQIRLAKDAPFCLKGKRKGKLPSLVEEPLCKQDYSEEEVEAPLPIKPQEPESSSDSESSYNEESKNVVIEIPPQLKEILEEDWAYITQKNKVFKLPCEHNVIFVLESYVKHLMIVLQNEAAAKNEKENAALHAEGRLHFCKEVMDGIRVYFDFTLPHLLLYRQEKKQFYTVGSTCYPFGISKNGGKINQRKDSTDTKSSNVLLSPKEEPMVTSPTRGGLRNHLSRQKSPASNEEEPSDISPQPKGSERSQAHRSKKVRSLGLRAGLRSSDKPKTTEEDGGSNDATNQSTNGSAEIDTFVRPDSPSVPTSPPRQTRRSSQHISPLSQTTTSTNHVKSPPSSKKASNPVTQGIVPAAQPTNNKEQAQTTPISNNNLTSPHTNNSNGKISFQSCDENKDLIETLWRLFPLHWSRQVPATPSLIYGGQHLLRLFVKLPELMYKTHMPRKKMIALLQVIHEFLDYLVEKKEDLFFYTYVDSDNETDGASERA